VAWSGRSRKHGQQFDQFLEEPKGNKGLSQMAYSKRNQGHLRPEDHSEGEATRCAAQQHSGPWLWRERHLSQIVDEEQHTWRQSDQQEEP
jgi:hypothetical protein